MDDSIEIGRDCDIDTDLKYLSLEEKFGGIKRNLCTLWPPSSFFREEDVLDDRCIMTVGIIPFSFTEKYRDVKKFTKSKAKFLILENYRQSMKKFTSLQMKVEVAKSFKSTENDQSDKTLARNSPNYKILSKIPTIKKLSQIKESPGSRTGRFGNDCETSYLSEEDHSRLTECSRRRLKKSTVDFSRKSRR